jgi:hypothetical protein
VILDTKVINHSNINVARFRVLGGILVVASATWAVPAGAQITVPEVTIPTDPATFFEWVRGGVNEGLDAAGIDLGRFPTLQSFINGIAEIQFIRFDDLPIVTGAWKEAVGWVEGTTGIDVPSLIEWGRRAVVGIFDAGLEWVKSNTE